jgi:hypothetical protein
MPSPNQGGVPGQHAVCSYPCLTRFPGPIGTTVVFGTTESSLLGAGRRRCARGCTAAAGDRPCVRPEQAQEG